MSICGSCGVCGRELGIADDIDDKCRWCGATLSTQVRLIEPYPGANRDTPIIFTEDDSQ